MFRIKQADGKFYIYELRGVCFVSWVNEKEKAMKLTEEQANEFLPIFENLAKEKLVIEPCE